MALLREEQAAMPDDPAITKEIAVNRPITPKGVLDTSFLDDAQPKPAAQLDTSFLDEDTSHLDTSFLDKEGGDPKSPISSWIDDKLSKIGLTEANTSRLPGAGIADTMVNAARNYGDALGKDPINTLSDTVHQGITGVPGFVVGEAEKYAQRMADPLGAVRPLGENGIPQTPIAKGVTDFIENTMSHDEPSLSPENRAKLNPEGWKAAGELFNAPAAAVGEELVRDTGAKGTEYEPHVRALGEEVVGAVFAAQMGGGMLAKAGAKPLPLKDLAAKAKEFHSSDIPTVIQKLTEAVDGSEAIPGITTRERYVLPEGKDRVQAIEEMLDGIDQIKAEDLEPEMSTDSAASDLGPYIEHATGDVNARYERNVANVLDLLADNDKADPANADVVEVARALRRLQQLGLELTPTLNKAILPAGAAGIYHPRMDSVSVGGTAGRNIGNRVRTFIHETTHAITAGLLDKYERNPEWFDAQGERGKVLKDRVQDFSSVYEEAKAAYAKEHGFDPSERVRDLQERFQTEDPRDHIDDAKWLHGEGYGWKNIHEFASEIMSDPKFRDALASLKRPHESVPRSAGNPRTIRTFWEPVKQAFIRMLTVGSSYKGTFLETAFEHLTGLMDDTRAGERVHAPDSPGERGRAHQKRLDEAVRKRQTSPLDNIAGDLARGLANQLREAGGDYSLFRTISSTFMEHPAWEAFLDKYGPKMWDNADTFIRAHGEYDPYLNHHPAAHQFVIDTRGVDQMFKDVLGRKEEVLPGEKAPALPETEDITSTGTYLLNDRNLAQHAAQSEKLGSKVQKWYLDQGGMYRNMESILYHRIIEHYGDFNKLSYKDKKGFMNAYAAMDNAGFRTYIKLHGRDGQWASHDMLKELGLNDAQMKAYDGITKGLDITHTMLDSIQKLTTGEPLERIPGYMPHFFDGPYKVAVQKIAMESREAPIVRVRGFNTRAQALAYVKELESGAHDLAGQKYQFRASVNPRTKQPFWVTKHDELANSMAATMSEHLRAYREELGLDPKIQQTLDQIDAKSALGFNKHLMDRSGVGGYRGELGAKEGHGFFTYKDNAKLFQIFQDYTKAATQHYKNSLFIDRVASRVLGEYPADVTGRRYYGSVMKDLKNTSNYLWEYTYNFTGENLNHLAGVDKFFQRTALYMGQNPHMVKQFVRELRNFFSQLQLRLNLKNKVANILQPGLVIGVLDWEASKLVRGGMKNVPTGMGSFARAVSMLRDDDMKNHIAWAESQHILDPQVDREIRNNRFGRAGEILHTATLGKLDSGIEEVGRRLSFVAAMDFYRKVFPNDLAAARRAAADVMHRVMVNYDRSSRPLMFQNFGTVGEALSPFAVFRNAWYGNMSLMLKEIAKDPKSIQAYRGFLSTQLFYLVTAGVSGMALAQEINWFIQKVWNNFFQENQLPSLEELMQQIGTPDVVAFGTVGASTKLIPGLDEGINLGPSTGSTGVADIASDPMLNFVVHGAQGAYTGAKYLASKAGVPVRPVTNEDLYAAGRAVLPTAPYVKSLPERLLKPDDGPDVAWKSSNQEANVERTESGQRIFDWTGSPSIEENKRAAAERFKDRTTKVLDDNLKAYVRSAADELDNRTSSITYAEARQRAVDQGTTPDEFEKLVNEEYMKRRLTAKQRDASKFTNQGAQSRFLRSLMGY
jgi:hypothetical protein